MSVTSNFESRVKELVSSGMSRREAVLQAVRENPKTHAQYVNDFNRRLQHVL